jgi:prepilin-type N-terminal cleavage/methylation domain-containing protein
MNTSQFRTRLSQRGFTLVETIIGLMILVIAASSIFFALSQMNRIAAEARLYTAAQFIVQSNINTIQSDSPFVPQNSQIPAELTLGTTSSNNVPIYVDPATGNTVASGTLTTTVTNISNTALSEYAYQATVQLAYSYRNKVYQVVESTVRGSDQ